jgi:hypothetical protein
VRTTDSELEKQDYALPTTDVIKKRAGRLAGVGEHPAVTTS